jgi:hypothetical protein
MEGEEYRPHWEKPYNERIAQLPESIRPVEARLALILEVDAYWALFPPSFVSPWQTMKSIDAGFSHNGLDRQLYTEKRKEFKKLTPGELVSLSDHMDYWIVRPDLNGDEDYIRRLYAPGFRAYWTDPR